MNIDEVNLVMTVSVIAERGASVVELPEGAAVCAAASCWGDEVSYLFCWPVSESGAPVHLAWVHRAALREM